MPDPYVPTADEIVLGKKHLGDNFWIELSEEQIRLGIEAIRAEERSHALHDAFWAVHVGRFGARNSTMDTFYIGTNAAKRAIEDLHGAPIKRVWAQRKEQ